jgi:metallophosphoesterase superfamily enzyme
VTVAMNCDGALYWPDERVLVVSDLHLEKGSSFATSYIEAIETSPGSTAKSIFRTGIRSSSVIIVRA